MDIRTRAGQQLMQEANKLLQENGVTAAAFVICFDDSDTILAPAANSKKGMAQLISSLNEAPLQLISRGKPNAFK